MSKPKQFKINNRIIETKAYRNFALGLFSFLVAFLVASSFSPVGRSDASTVEITNNTSDYYIRITSADALPFSVEAKPTGQLAYKADTINITTNSDNGYKLYVSTSGNDNNIYQNGDSSTSSEGYFGPTTGTVDAPTNLAQNTWGFALNKTQSTSISSAFADYDEYVNETLAPTIDSTWAKVPTYANSADAKISELSVANAPGGTSFDIFYGINASTTLPDGTYSTEITYTAISEGVNKFPTMQDFTAEQCYNMATDTSINLSDARDDKYYRVTKMKDGHCWMTDNLALDGTDASGNPRVLTPADSNVSSNYAFPAGTDIENGTTSVDTTPQIYTGVANDVTDSCDTTTYPDCIVNTSTKYGNLYNFMAATAGQGTASFTGTATQSVCPKGWQLPDNDGVYSYQNLMLHYGLPTTNGTNHDAVQTAQKAPLNFSLVGYYGHNKGVSANYWSSHVYTTQTQAYGLSFNSLSGRFAPQDADYKSRGFAIRCVFSGQSTDPTMQDFTTAECINLANHASKVLVDKRNNQFYRIVKAIGNTGDSSSECWMADNLSIYNQTISAADSDFTSPTTYTLPAPITATTDWNTNDYQTKKIEVAHGLGQYATTDSTYYGQVLYNWTTAVAKETTAGVTTAPGTSICPKNWQLPVNGTDTTAKSYAHLLANAASSPITTGTQLLENSYLGFSLYYGMWHWNLASESGQGIGGLFWSGTPSSEAGAYRLDYSSRDVHPKDSDHKGYGFSIRCVHR